MSQRTKVIGSRRPVILLLIFIAVLVVAGLVVGVLVVYPQIRQRQEDQVRLAQAAQHYQAGVAFQDVEDWTAAEVEYKTVVSLDAGYKDIQARLADVRARLNEGAAAATATVAALPTTTAEALEVRYQKGLGYINMGRWIEAAAEL